MVEAASGAVSLVNLLSRWRRTFPLLKEMDLEEARWSAAQSAMDLLQFSHNALREVATRIQARIPEGSTVISHGGGSTVTEIFRQCRDKGVRLILTEDGVEDRGRNLIEKLSRWKIPTILIPAAQLGHFVAQADLAVVGAHCLLTDGSVVNTPGTYLLALATHDRGIPFYVCCESFKRCAVPADEPSPEEISKVSDIPSPLEHIVSASVQLEITPAWLVTDWITELGESVDTPPGSM